MGFSLSKIVRKVGHAVGGVVKSVTGGTLAKIVPPLALVVPTKANLEGAAAGLAVGASLAAPVAAFAGTPTVPTAAPATMTAGGGGPMFPGGGGTSMAVAIPAASGGGFNLNDLLGLAGTVGQAFGIKELKPFAPGAGMVEGGGGVTTAGINIPITGTSPVETAEVADYCLPKDPQKRRMREWLIRASINSGVRVTPKKILSAVKLLGIEGTALALNVNRPLAAPFVQPAMVSAIVIDALTRRRRGRRCVISRRDVSQVRRTARTFASLSSDLASIKAGTGRRAITVRSSHRSGCGCVVCKRR